MSTQVLAHLLFLLFCAFAVLISPTATGHPHRATTTAQEPVASDDDDVCCGGLVLFLAEYEETSGLADSDGDAGTLIGFQHGLPAEATSAAVSAVPSRFTLLRASTSAPRAPPAEI